MMLLGTFIVMSLVASVHHNCTLMLLWISFAMYYDAKL